MSACLRILVTTAQSNECWRYTKCTCFAGALPKWTHPVVSLSKRREITKWRYLFESIPVQYGLPVKNKLTWECPCQTSALGSHFPPVLRWDTATQIINYPNKLCPHISCVYSDQTHAIWLSELYNTVTQCQLWEGSTMNAKVCVNNTRIHTGVIVSETLAPANNYLSLSSRILVLSTTITTCTCQNRRGSWWYSNLSLLCHGTHARCQTLNVPAYTSSSVQNKLYRVTTENKTAL